MPTAMSPASFPAPLAASGAVLVALLAACSGNDGASKPPAGTPVVAAQVAPPRPGFAKRRHLHAQGKAAYATGDWDTCARLFEAAHDWADAGRCAAHMRDPERGLDDLRRALAHDVRELAQLRDDSELVPLRRDPRWQPMIAAASETLAVYRSAVNSELAQLAGVTTAASDPDEPPPELAVGPSFVPSLAAADEPPPSPAVFRQRCARVAEIVAAGGATIADDYLHAAVVYYRADTGDDATRAHELALAALDRDPDSDDVKWLVAATEDRRLKHEGKPQRFGTQFTISRGTRVLWNVDPSVSDSERERWSVPSLAEAIAGDAETATTTRIGEPPR